MWGAERGSASGSTRRRKGVGGGAGLGLGRYAEAQGCGVRSGEGLREEGCRTQTADVGGVALEGVCIRLALHVPHSDGGAHGGTENEAIGMEGRA